MSKRSRYDATPVRIGLGSSDSLAKCKVTAYTWAQFRSRIRKPVRTNERFKTYQSMTIDQKNDLKKGAGWYIGGPTKNNRRNRDNVIQRDIITFDVDHATPEFFEDFINGDNPISEYEYYWHTSRSHHPDKPKFRVILLPAEPVIPEQYDAVVRLLAQKFDPEMTAVDHVSFRLAQMMFWPSCSKDSEYDWDHNDGELVDPETVLKSFKGDWRDYSQLPRTPMERKLRASLGKAEDPTAKGGVIGAFCRTYSIEEAIETFLSDVYVPGDSAHGETRYTYVGSTTSNGAVVYDDGKFLYSHHASDPAGDRNLNAFDLVRVHLFETEEELKSSDPDDNIAGKKSFKAMVEFVKEDPEARKTLAQESIDYEAMVEDSFEDLNESNDPDDAPNLLKGTDAEEEDLLGFPIPPVEGELPKPPFIGEHRPPKVPKDWIAKYLEIDPQGQFKKSLTNIATILTYSPHFAGVFGYNEFAQAIRVRRSMRSKISVVKFKPVRDPVMGDKPEDSHITQVRLVLEAERGNGKAGWGFSQTGEVTDKAVDGAAQHYIFNPVKEMLERQWQGWDGKRGRLERLWIEVAGAPDNAYTRRTAVLWLVASVARTYHPGHKFDYMPILMGAQGQGKSTLGTVLFGDTMFGRLTADFSKNLQGAVEQMMGKRALEWPEIASLRRAEVEDSKQFIDATHDEVRLAYDRRTGIFYRTCVFIGTTNETEFLKDETGNRRFWPIETTFDKFKFDWLQENLDQIWGEAMQVYWEMTRAWDYRKLPLFLPPEIEALAIEAQEAHKEETQEEQMRAAIAEWVTTPVPRSAVTGEADDFADPDDEPMVLRTRFRTEDAGVHALGMLPDKARSNPVVAKALKRVKGLTHAQRRVGGNKARWWVLDDATDEEVKRGYRLVDEDLI